MTEPISTKEAGDFKGGVLLGTGISQSCIIHFLARRLALHTAGLDISGSFRNGETGEGEGRESETRKWGVLGRGDPSNSSAPLF